MQTERSEEIDTNLIQRVLIPYTGKGTAYLKSARASFKASDTLSYIRSGDQEYSVRSDFSIRDSCYINDTGHFNAVEFNICYNQLFYVAIAHACSQKCISYLQNLTLDEFYVKQLPNIYITRLESHYKRPIDSSNFSGILNVEKIKKIQKMIVFKTSIKFLDLNEGLAYGKVDVVIT